MVRERGIYTYVYKERLLETDKYINTRKIPIMNTLLIRYAI